MDGEGRRVGRVGNVGTVERLGGYGGDVETKMPFFRKTFPESTHDIFRYFMKIRATTVALHEIKILLYLCYIQYTVHYTYQLRLSKNE